jgi:hypothetical protein
VSATDVTDGDGEEVARDGSDDEAAWLELIGRFDAPAGSANSPAPWPEREDLVAPGPAGATPADQSVAADDTGEDTGQGPADGSGLGADGGGLRADGSGLGADGADRGGVTTSGEFAIGGRTAPGGETVAGGEPSGDEDTAAGLGSTGPWPDRENLPPPTPRPSELGPWAGGRPGVPVYRRFELPTPTDPRSWTAPDEDEDEGHYTPPPPPPLPSMSPVTKGAWVALFGGPAYLLTATLAGWTVAGWALFLAIAAFVGGFTVLALRLGDRPDDGSGPDDGAVV